MVAIVRPMKKNIFPCSRLGGASRQHPFPAVPVLLTQSQVAWVAARASPVLGARHRPPRDPGLGPGGQAKVGVSPEAARLRGLGMGRGQGVPGQGPGRGPTLPPAEMEALVHEEAQRELQAREQEEIKEVDQAQQAQAAQPCGAAERHVSGKGAPMAAGGNAGQPEGATAPPSRGRPAPY